METETKEEKQIGEMVKVEIDKPVFQKLEALAKQKGCDTYFLLTDMILEKTKKAGSDAEARKKLAQALGGDLITVNVQLFEPFVKFAKEYMQFFGVKDTFEVFCMKLIYNELERVHQDLSEFVHSKDMHFIDGGEWYSKHPHLGAADTDPESDEKE